MIKTSETMHKHNNDPRTFFKFIIITSIEIIFYPSTTWKYKFFFTFTSSTT